MFGHFNADMYSSSSNNYGTNSNQIINNSYCSFVLVAFLGLPLMIATYVFFLLDILKKRGLAVSLVVAPTHRPPTARTTSEPRPSSHFNIQNTGTIASSFCPDLLLCHSTTLSVCSKSVESKKQKGQRDL